MRNPIPRPALVALFCFLQVPPALAEPTDHKVCVRVLLKDTLEAAPTAAAASPTTDRPTTTADPSGQASAQVTPPGERPVPRPALPPVSVEAAPFLPRGQNPVSYLERLLEHFVTHERGFAAVEEGCQDELIVELYPLREGWTAFSRYTGTGREERVDQLYAAELSAYAERAVLAVLHDLPIAGTINRENVLRADSRRSTQQIRGTSHWVLGLGTQLRTGVFETAQDDGSADNELRLFSPMTLSLGYRGKYEAWGIEAGGQLGLGTSKTANRKNPLGGHTDFGGSLDCSLHLLRYLNPRGLSSWYTGAGSTFALLWFNTLGAQDADGYYYESDSRNTLFAGGLDLDLLVGYEFMRASRVHFMLQGELHLPAYIVQTSNVDASLQSWFPGLGLKLGMVF